MQQFAALDDEVNAGLRLASTRADALAKRVGEVHGTATEAACAAQSARTVAQEVSSRLHGELCASFARGSASDASLKDDVEQLRVEVGIVRDMQQAVMNTVDKSIVADRTAREARDAVHEANVVQDCEMASVQAQVRSLGRELRSLAPQVDGFNRQLAPLQAAVNDATCNRTELQRIHEDFGRQLDGAVAELADHVVNRGKFLDIHSPHVANRGKLLDTHSPASLAMDAERRSPRLGERTLPGVSSRTCDAQLTGLATNVERLAQEIMRDGQMSESYVQTLREEVVAEQMSIRREFDDRFRCMSAQIEELRDHRQAVGWCGQAAGCGDLAADQRSLRQDVEKHLHRFTMQLEEVELFTRRELARYSAAGAIDSPGTAAASAAVSMARSNIATVTAELARLQKEVEQTARLQKDTEHAARRVAQEEVIRAADQHRAAEIAQRGELWRELRELRGQVGELRARWSSTPLAKPMKPMIRLGEL
jgi:hypothetical protein